MKFPEKNSLELFRKDVESSALKLQKVLRKTMANQNMEGHTIFNKLETQCG